MQGPNANVFVSQWNIGFSSHLLFVFLQAEDYIVLPVGCMGQPIVILHIYLLMRLWDRSLEEVIWSNLLRRFIS